jgi:catechol 2,3-dioxygenase-like lactoylglutathione lyase family enzyme
VSVNARDLEESVEVYVDLLGAERIATPNFGLPVQWLALGRTQLHLFEKDLQPTSHHHLGITVDDLDGLPRGRAPRRLRPRGVRQSPRRAPRRHRPALRPRPGGQPRRDRPRRADRLPDDLRAQIKPLSDYNPRDDEQMSARLFVPE